MLNTVIISAAGQGVRCSGYSEVLPKQFIKVNDEPIYITTIKKFIRDDISQILLIIQPERKDMVEQQLKEYLPGCNIILVLGGNTAEESRYNALLYLSKQYYIGNVIFHDAVRPLVNHQLITNVINALNNSDNAVPVIICKDSMYNINTGIIDVQNTFRMQTPQGFDFKKIFDCYNTYKWFGSPGLTYYKQYNTVNLINGDESNFKITTIDDIELYKMINK